MSKHERYVEVCKQMELLGITDVSTQRQKNNDTRVWRLPIKLGKDRFIEVASFATGYVRNQNSGYSNYQLNKRCDSEPQYYKLSNGYYNKYTTRSCVLIPNEIDRLEYLIAYCLKNYYIKNANQVVNGSYVPKWKYDEVTRWKLQDCGHYDRINALECSNETWKNLADEWKERYESEVDDLKSDVFTQKQRGDGYKEGLENMKEARDYYKNSCDDFVDGGEYRIKDLERMLDGYKTREKDLENKLDKLDKFNESLIGYNKAMNTHEVSVTVNGQKYKVI